VRQDVAHPGDEAVRRDHADRAADLREQASTRAGQLGEHVPGDEQRLDPAECARRAAP
jgi:hypothetical protein